MYCIILLFNQLRRFIGRLGLFSQLEPILGVKQWEKKSSTIKHAFYAECNNEKIIFIDFFFPIYKRANQMFAYNTMYVLPTLITIFI